MEMTFNKYIGNPTGGTSAITNRKMYKNLYTEKFDILMVRENGELKFKVYKAKDFNDTHYIHFKMPSETCSGIYYDTVIQLSTTSKEAKSSANLRGYNIKFYSNDPAFVYSFAHAFNKNGLFIQDLKDKMSRQALRDVAKVRNPKDDIFYVKSLYFAYLAMDRYNLFDRKTLDDRAEKYSRGVMRRDIMHSEDKLVEINDAKEKAKKGKQDSKANDIKKYNDKRNQDVKSKQSNITNTSKVSKIIKKTPTTKSSKTTKIVGMKRKS